jgi:molybdenum cofactor biosynthesis enzyme MoaA
MRIRTFSVLAGSRACNARCPFCISRMTVSHGMKLQEPEINWRNFRKACLLAVRSGAVTAMITGKGEPTLFPDMITRYLRAMQEYEFPLLELQTNGIAIMEDQDRYSDHLSTWFDLGLNTVAVSIIHYDPDKNHRVFVPYKERYIDLPGLVSLLKGKGLTVRLSCVLVDGYIDSPEGLERLIGFARETGAEQLTVVPVNRPFRSDDPNVAEWIRNNGLRPEQASAIADFLTSKGVKLLEFKHGAIVYDVGGQNVCLSSCLTATSQGNEIRNLIFFPDGHIRYDWQYAGATLL